jgi:hypothetical protein
MKKLFASIMAYVLMAFGLNAAGGLPSGTVVKIVPAYSPHATDPDYPESAQTQVEGVRNGTLKPLTSVNKDSFTYSSVQLAELGGRGGMVIWWLDVTAPEGQLLSLDMITASITSRDGALKKEQTFTGMSYTPFAIGLRSDSTFVVSGDASQTAHRVIVGVHSKAFPANTADKVREVRTYLGIYPDWFTTCTVGSVSKTLTFTEPVVTIIPSLFIRRNGEMTKLWAETNGYPSLLNVQQTIDGKNFTDSGMTIMSGGSLVVDTSVKSTLYRLHK